MFTRYPHAKSGGCVNLLPRSPQNLPGAIYMDNENVGDSEQREKTTSTTILSQQLQNELSKKHMLFQKHHVQLGGVVGQGDYCHSACVHMK